MAKKTPPNPKQQQNSSNKQNWLSRLRRNSSWVEYKVKEKLELFWFNFKLKIQRKTSANVTLKSKMSEEMVYVSTVLKEKKFHHHKGGEKVAGLPASLVKVWPPPVFSFTVSFRVKHPGKQWAPPVTTCSAREQLPINGTSVLACNGDTASFQCWIIFSELDITVHWDQLFDLYAATCIQPY